MSLRVPLAPLLDEELHDEEHGGEVGPRHAQKHEHVVLKLLPRVETEHISHTGARA